MTRAGLRFIFALLGKSQHRLKVLFANGSVWKNYTDDEAELTICFKTSGAERHSLLFFFEGFFEKYIDGEVDLIGEFPVTLLSQMGSEVQMGNRKSVGGIYMYGTNPLMVLRKIFQEWMQSNKQKALAKKNAEFHYAIHPKLFEEMLGETVGYSEGYWIDGTEGLNQAKHNNYEYICQKLQLKPREKVLEVGPGWGFMPIYMVKNYGVEVTVYNPVKRQNEYMRERFARHGVADRIKIIEADHRDIVKEVKHSYDKFVTVGVHEHHGMALERYDEWWASIAHVLRPGGVGVISTSSLMQHGATNFLILKYIWPGGHFPSLPHELMAMDRNGLTLVEVENLWPQYQRALAEWRARFQERWPEIQKADPAFFTERFRRLWSMYLESATDVFNHSLDLSHIIFTNGRKSDYYPKSHEVKHKGNFHTDGQEVECYR